MKTLAAVVILLSGGVAPPNPPTRSLAGTAGSPLRSRGSLVVLARAVLMLLMTAAWSASQTSPFDLVALDMGGHVESITSEVGVSIGAVRLIDGNPRTYWLSQTEVKYPVEVVFSFFGRQAAVIQAVTIQPSAFGPSRAKDIEVWSSNESPTGPFTKVGAFTVAPNGVQSFPVPAVEARYLKLSLLSNYGDKRTV